MLACLIRHHPPVWVDSAEKSGSAQEPARVAVAGAAHRGTGAGGEGERGRLLFEKENIESHQTGLFIC